MTVPGRIQAARTLLRLDPPVWSVRHASGVADVAAWLAAKVAARGAPLSSRVVEAAALLHDVDKILPAADPARRLPHGIGSADWLRRLDHAELGPIVAAHPVTRLADDEAAAWVRTGAVEELIVAYADKRVGQRLEPMAERFASWARRYPDSGVARDRMRAVAEELEARVCELAGVEPAEVRRLRWAGRALRQARAAPRPGAA